MSPEETWNSHQCSTCLTFLTDSNHINALYSTDVPDVPAPETPAWIFLCWTQAWSETLLFPCWDYPPPPCFPVKKEKQSVCGCVCCIRPRSEKIKNERTQNNSAWRVFFSVSAYIEGSQGLADALLDEVVCDASRRVLVEDGVHQRDLGCAASGFGLGGTELADGNTPIISSSCLRRGVSCSKRAS